MNHKIEIHQWDPAEVRTAKRYLNGDIQIGALEMRRILLAVLDDREQWAAKATIARDLLLKVSVRNDQRIESERALMGAISTQVREISAMLCPCDSQPCTTDELNEATPNMLRRQAE